MKKKLTDYQVENLIESILKKNAKVGTENLKRTYITKLRESKTKKEKYRVLSELYSMRYSTINESYGKVNISEGILADIITKGFGGSWSTVKEYVYNMVLGKVNEMFGNKLDPELIKAMSIGLADIDLTDNWRKFLSPIQNCEFFADAAMDGIIEYYIDKKVDEYFGDTFFGDSIRNAVADALTDQDNVQAIQNKVSGVICNAIKSAFGGAKSMDLGGLFGKMTGGGSPSPAAV